MNPVDAKHAAAKAFNNHNLVSFVVGAEVADVINVAVTLKTARGGTPAGKGFCKCYLASDAAGTTITPTATTSAIAIGTNGTLINTPISGKMVDVLSNGSGLFDLNIPQTATPVAYYLVVVLPDGSIAVSSVIQF